MITRRAFLKYTGATVLALYAWDGTRPVAVAHAVPGGSLDPTGIPQFVEPLVVPATMPSARREGAGPQGPIDVYDIAVRQFEQRMLPTPLPLTTVWGYGPTGQGRDTFHAPSMTIEATHGTPIRVTWRNELVDDRRGYLSHLLPVDPTLHWANPERRPGHGGAVTDTKPDFSGLGYAPPGEFSDSGTQYTLYSGPVPLVTHVHGAVGVGDESDGYPEAWYLPVASNLDTAYAPHGAWYEFFRAKAKAKLGVDWAPGTQTSHYPNTSSECTLWYHDHTLGLTRLNVYAGPAGFFLVRGGPEGEDGVLDARTRKPAVLPGPEKGQGQGNAPVRDIPIAIQDRSFNADGSLFYPDARAIFDEYAGPFVPETPVPPAWNPEFFGNTLIANGRTWPFLEVEQRRYRLRLLNGCNSRFLILEFSGIPGVKVALVGNDGGFLPEVHDVMADRGRLLLGTAERADVISTSPTSRSAIMCSAISGPTSPTAAASPALTSKKRSKRPRGGSCSSGSGGASVLIRRPLSSSCSFRSVPRCRPRCGPDGSPCSNTNTVPARRPPRRLRCWAHLRTGTVGSRPWRAPGWTRSPRTRGRARPRCGRSSTSPPTPTPSMCTRCCSRSSAGAASPWRTAAWS